MFPTKSKYKNKKVKIDGLTFDSIKESKHYCELIIRSKAGEIQDLMIQPVFNLMPSVKWNNQTLRKRSYIADFMYTDFKLKKTVVVDVKGFKTDMYKLKRHMFLIKYPEYIFMEV